MTRKRKSNSVFFYLGSGASITQMLTMFSFSTFARSLDTFHIYKGKRPVSTILHSFNPIIAGARGYLGLQGTWLSVALMLIMDD